MDLSQIKSSECISPPPLNPKAGNLPCLFLEGTFQMLKSLFGPLCKIGTLLKFSWNKTNSPTIKSNTSTSGAQSPIHIGDVHHHSEPEVDPRSRFTDRLIALAHELPFNFRHCGNTKNPFILTALKKLVHETPEIHQHQHQQLFDLASKCFSTAQILNTSTNPKLRPAQGQALMKELAQLLTDKYGITAPDRK